MRIFKIKFAHIILLIFALIVLNYNSAGYGKDFSPQEIATNTTKSVVLIVTQDNKGRELSLGSGFFFGNGYVATCLHVFQRASQGYIKLIKDDINCKIDKIIAFDLKRDLCVFTINTSKPPVPPLTLATKTDIKIGDEVYAVGNPRGLEGTFSKGIISGIRQKEGLIQIDAPISSGSSGGPVVNNRGEVIGIATATIVGGQNLNFAIPINYLISLSKKYKLTVSDIGALSVSARELMMLKGPVRTLITKETELKQNSKNNEYFEGPMRVRDETYFNEQGNNLEHKLYSNMGFEYCELPIINAVSEYGERGILLKRTSTTREFNEAKKTCKGKTKKQLFNEEEGLKFMVDMNKNYRIEEMMTYSYDNNGNIIEENYFANKKLVHSSRYYYKQLDQYGNWTKRTRYLMATRTFNSFSDEEYSPYSIEYREITYY